MRLQKIYYKLGGHKGSFLQKKWSNHVLRKMEKEKRQLLQSVGREALDAMNAACQEAHVQFGLEFGTMLGAYREKGFIPFDDDIDLTMMASDCTRDFENILLKHGFYKKRAFYLVKKNETGRESRQLSEIALSYHGLQVDIFFCYPKTDVLRSVYVYCNPVVDGKMTVREFLLPYDGKTYPVTIQGHTYKVFSEPKQTLSLIYGEDFMTPQENANATKNEHSHVKVHEITECYGEAYILE